MTRWHVATCCSGPYLCRTGRKAVARRYVCDALCQPAAWGSAHTCAVDSSVACMAGTAHLVPCWTTALGPGCRLSVTSVCGRPLNTSAWLGKASAMLDPALCKSSVLGPSVAGPARSQLTVRSGTEGVRLRGRRRFLLLVGHCCCWHDQWAAGLSCTGDTSCCCAV